jgi:hypothetical protein
LLSEHEKHSFFSPQKPPPQKKTAQNHQNRKKQMLFRLSDGSVLELNDNDMKLSDFFETIHAGVTPLDLVSDFLKKSTFKKVRSILVRELPPTFSEMQDPEIRRALQEKLVAISSSNTESIQLTDALKHIVTNFDTIFHTIVHSIKFLTDNTLKLVLEFLTISCPQRSSIMMDNLPFLLQGCPPDTPISSLVVTNMQPYIAFVEARTEDELMQLSRAGCLLGIKPLITLVGCKIAKLLVKHTELHIRNKFKIPEKFKDSVLERIQKIPDNDKWMQIV